MKMLHVIVSAVVGGAIGFAASHTISQRDDPAPMVAAAVDKAVKGNVIKKNTGANLKSRTNKAIKPA